MSEASTKEPRSQFKVSRLTGSVVILIAIGLLFFFFGPVYLLESPQTPRGSVTCLGNLKQLGLGSLIYADDYDGQYPAAERWCDLLADGYIEAETFRCPKAETGPCNYAMNPHADPNRAKDVVLLFESKPGWNQYGGPELLATESHNGEGCNVLFVDGHVEFVKAEELGMLKWQNERTLAPEPNGEQQLASDEE